MRLTLEGSSYDHEVLSALRAVAEEFPGDEELVIEVRRSCAEPLVVRFADGVAGLDLPFLRAMSSTLHAHLRQPEATS